MKNTTLRIAPTDRRVSGRGWRRLAVLAALLLAGTAGVLSTFSTSAADPGKTGYPNSMAATGDSFTLGYQTTCGTNNICPANSWSTGTNINSPINSHYTRILAANSLISSNNRNDAQIGSGIKYPTNNLTAQVTTVNSQHVEYVTIMMGAADVCAPTEGLMPTALAFGSQFQTDLATLSLGSPDARIYVSSIWDVYQLWLVLHTDPNATLTPSWWVAPFSFCQSMLANATSTDTADEDRRQRVRQRNMDYNTQLQSVCAQYIHCRFDNNALFNAPLTAADVSTVDYLHPSLTGQARLASVSYGATFDFTDSVAPVSSGTIVPTGGGATVSLNATDNVDVSGIEYKIGAGAWTRYVSSVFVADGSTITYRAVDVNGNIEASHSFTSGVATVGGIAEAVDPATLPSATAAASGNDRAVYGLAGVVGVLAAVAGAGALWRRRRVR